MAGSPGRRPVWTINQADRAHDLHGQGWSVQRIADEVGLTYATTRRLLVRAGLVVSITENTAHEHRDQLIRLVRELQRGVCLKDAAAAVGITEQQGRERIRLAAELAPEGLNRSLQQRAAALGRHLKGGDVRAAARVAEIDPWFALFLLIASGSKSVSMQPRMQPETLELAARMAERRAAGASFQTIGREFGMTHQRVRRILLAAGGWTSPNQRRTAAQTTTAALGDGTGDEGREDVGPRRETTTSNNAKAAKTTATKPTAVALSGRRRKA